MAGDIIVNDEYFIDVEVGMKKTQRLIYVMSIVFVLVACGTGGGDIAPIVSPPDVNSTAVLMASTMIAETMTAAPTPSVLLTETPIFPTPTRTPFPFMELEGLRTVYVGLDNEKPDSIPTSDSSSGAFAGDSSDGVLYVQDSGKQIVRIAEGVKINRQYYYPPLVSDDGQKIVFYRVGEGRLDSVFSINADGSGERVLINPQLLSAFGKEYGEHNALFSLAFVPGTHLLAFNTDSQGHFDPETSGWLPIVGKDLFIVNTDTGRLKQLKPTPQGGNFLVAPNGKWIAVQTSDHIDIMDVGGRLVKSNLVTYDKTEAHIVIPMAWTQDLTELIILPSGIPLYAGGVTVERTIRRYPVDGSPSTETYLTPPPIFDFFAVSPDGNWIVYVQAPNYSLYLGNLRDGTTRLLYSMSSPSQVDTIDAWSPDNVHFIFHDRGLQSYLGNIYGEITPIDVPRSMFLSGWIDDTRYLMDNGVLGEVGTQELLKVADSYADTFAFFDR